MNRRNSKESQPVRQEVLWVPWVAMESLVTGGKWTPVPLKEQPQRVWTLYRHTDENVRPALPIVPIHGHGAFLEDCIHDWNWNKGHFRYYSRVMNCGVWVLLEY